MMRLLSSCLLSASLASAFVSPTAFVSTSKETTTSSTSLYISSWGTKGPPSRWSSEQKKKNPLKDIQSYIPAPQPVDARDTIEGEVLVSGLVKSPERTDQTMFDLLNSEVAAFEYSKIIAFVDNVKFSKKRLLSRHARYTGLLDKLDFMEAASPGALPTAEQLDGIGSWVAYVEGGDLLDQVKQIANLAQSCTSLKSVAILLVGAQDLDPTACQEAVDLFKNGRTDLEYTLVAVGSLEDTPEGSVPYRFQEFTSKEGVIPTKASFSRAESLRLLTELLQLDCGINRTLSFTEVYDEEDAAYKLIKGLREAGYPRPTEVDHMIRIGVKAYEDAIEEFKTENPYDGATSDNWWEDERFLANMREREAERSGIKSKLAEVEPEKDERTLEVEKIAKEWAKREYFRLTMEGTVGDLTEEEFTSQNWDRALYEGERKYRQLHGETVGDEEVELANFKKKQELKKEAMLKRAKEELSQVLEEENLGGEDLEKKLASLKAEDDKTDSDD